MNQSVEVETIKPIEVSSEYVTQFDPAMFSLEETESYYILALDIPTIPAVDTQVFTSKFKINVDCRSENPQGRQTLFRMFSRNEEIRSLYINGVLYLFLPKNKKSQPIRMIKVACI